jgi:hypothetical protein
MSGWIKVEKDLRDDPRVIRMGRELRNAGVTHERFTAAMHVTLVLGCLEVLWCYADTHIRQDDTLDLGVDEIDELVGLKGFCDLMPPDWLEVIDAQSVKLPDFHAHNGTEAKKKAQSQKRQERKRNADALQELTQASRTSVTSALPDQDQTKTNTQTKKENTAASPRVADESDDDLAFEALRSVYPQRSGDQKWREARQAVNARLREGHTWEQILDGARRYAAWCKATGKLNTETVKQAATFVGPGKPFLESWALPATKADTRLAGNLSAAEEFMRRTEAVQ